jgi:hypothetical protein
VVDALKVTAIVLTAAFLLAPVVIETVREVVHTRRERRVGIASTQDVAMWGTLVMGGCGAAAVAAWAAWYVLK